MTFAEILLVIAFIGGLIWLMKPFQRWLEVRLYKILKSKRNSAQGSQKPVIDITDYTKKGKH